MTRDLSSLITETFNGCEIIKQELARKEKVEFVPLTLSMSQFMIKMFLYHVILQRKFPLHTGAI